MAQKGYPGHVNNPPPPTVYTYPNSTVVVQQTQPTVVHKSSGGLFGKLKSGLDQVGREITKGADWTADQINKSLSTTATGNILPGLFGQIGRELNLLGKTVSRAVDYTADEINKSIATTATGQVLTLFQSGNVVQLVSRASGRSLQIVQGPAGLVVDGLGQDGMFNVQWTVVNEGANQVRLHNNNNFLAVVNGATVIMHMPPGSVHTNNTKFQLSQIGQFIVLASMNDQRQHVGVMPRGELKAALACGREDHAQFGIKLVIIRLMLGIASHETKPEDRWSCIGHLSAEHSPHGVVNVKK